MAVDWVAMATLFVAVVGMLFAFSRWFISWAETRDVEQEQHFNDRINEHKEEFKNVHSRIDKHVDELNDTRDKLHTEFVKHSDLREMRKELREDFNSIFQKMGGISKSLNQLIGAVNGKVKDE